MKKIILGLLATASFAACNNASETVTTKDTVAEVKTSAPVIFPYTPTYSGDFSIGNPELTKKVLDMYKAVEENKMDDLGQYYADTVTRYNFQQKQMVLSREAMVALAKQFRNQFKEFSETPLAFTALHSNDRNEDWVVTWIKEKVMYNNGKVDSTIYQENWRFRDGKIYMVDSYAKYAK
jgi:ketosteroid isomerase-like protein